MYFRFTQKLSSIYQFVSKTKWYNIPTVKSENNPLSEQVAFQKYQTPEIHNLLKICCRQWVDWNTATLMFTGKPTTPDQRLLIYLVYSYNIGMSTIQWTSVGTCGKQSTEIAHLYGGDDQVLWNTKWMELWSIRVKNCSHSPPPPPQTVTENLATPP